MFTGEDTTTSHGFTNGELPEDLEVVLDSTAKTATLRYDPDVDDFDDIVNALEDSSDVTVTLIYGTSGSSVPVDPPFTYRLLGIHSVRTTKKW